MEENGFTMIASGQGCGGAQPLAGPAMGHPMEPHQPRKDLNGVQTSKSRPARSTIALLGLSLCES